MRLIQWTDDDGLKHLSWVRNRDPDGLARRIGIPHDPPDLSGLGLLPEAARNLHNALVERRLVVWWKAAALRKALAAALVEAGLDSELISGLLALYAERRETPRPRGTLDLEHALRTSTLSGREQDCIRTIFAQTGISTLAALENAPTTFKGHICGVDIYQLIAHIRAASLE